MSFAVVQNGQIRQVLQMDIAFTVGDKQYSSAFLRNSTPEEKLEAGVWEIIEGTRPDDRFYWVSNASYHINEVNSTVEASYPATAKNLGELKANAIAQAKAAAGSALAATDWQVIRKAERGIEVTPEVAVERAAIVSDCTAKETAIAAATSVEELISALSAKSVSEPQMPAADSVTFETIELDANKEYLLLKVACGQPSAHVMIFVSETFGNSQQFEGVLDDTGRFGCLAPVNELKDGTLELLVLINHGEVQTQTTFELSRAV